MSPCKITIEISNTIINIPLHNITLPLKIDHHTYNQEVCHSNTQWHARANQGRMCHVASQRPGIQQIPHFSMNMLGLIQKVDKNKMGLQSVA